MNRINEIGEVGAKEIIRRRERTTGDVLATKKGSKFSREFKSGHEKQQAGLQFRQRNRKLGGVNKPLIFRKQGIAASTENKYSSLSKLLMEAPLAPSEIGKKVFFKGVGGEKGVMGRKVRPWVKTPAFDEPENKKGLVGSIKKVARDFNPPEDDPNRDPVKVAFNKRSAEARDVVKSREKRLALRAKLRDTKGLPKGTNRKEGRKYPTLSKDTTTPEEKPGMEPISARKAKTQGTQQKFATKGEPKETPSGTGLAKRGALRSKGSVLNRVRKALGSLS
jgi:hypothetical protein